MRIPWKHLRRGAVTAIALLVLLQISLIVLIRPSHNRNWTTLTRILPEVSVNGNMVTIRNFRDFRYQPDGTPVPRYTTETFDLTQLRRAWFVMEPFSRWKGAAHTLVSFEFEGPKYLAVSVEARFEEGEPYSGFTGLFRQYELWYTVGSESDLLGLRTNVRDEPMSLYPVKAEPDRGRAVLVSLLEGAEGIRKKPEFYHTLTNNCTSRLYRHVNLIAPGTVPFGLKALFPGYADRIAYEKGLIDTDLPYDRIRAAYSINAAAKADGLSERYSEAIRQHLPGLQEEPAAP